MSLELLFICSYVKRTLHSGLEIQNEMLMCNLEEKLLKRDLEI